MKDKKLYAFMVNDAINFNIDELVTYLEDNYPGMDLSNIKKNYIYVQPNGGDLNKALVSFIVEKVTEINEDIENLDEVVTENLSRFFELTEKKNDIIIVERATNN